MKAKNDKAPSGGAGALTRQRDCLTLNLHIERDGSLTGCSSLVKHPTTPKYSGTLVGVTTRRDSSNPHRGRQPVGAQREVGKRKWHQGNLAKVADSRMAPTVISPCTISLGDFRLDAVQDSPTVISPNNQREVSTW